MSQVTPDSPAAAAGLEQGDVILSYNGQPIKELRDLTSKVADTDPGKTAEMQVWRAGKEMNVNVEIGNTPATTRSWLRPSSSRQRTARPKLGVALARLTPEARQSMDLPADLQGVVVANVQEGSPAAMKGLQSGDVIVEVDHQQVTEPKTVADAVRDAGNVVTRPSCCWSSTKARIASSRSRWSAPERSPGVGQRGWRGDPPAPLHIRDAGAPGTRRPVRLAIARGITRSCFLKNSAGIGAAVGPSDPNAAGRRLHVGLAY